MDTALEKVARHVNWYTDPERLLANTDLFLCQVMARGSVHDIVTIRKTYSQEALRKAYLHAPPGLFTKRRWSYWSLMLADNSKRPLPERFPGANHFDWKKFT